ncbi:Fe-Mn family superoxide dismutase [Nonomuraea basaltis]|nr:Fe-Mn family superoxide dismutase [Nonomuraea basaltis]
MFDAWEHAYYLRYRYVRPTTSRNCGASSTGPMWPGALLT